MFRPARPDEADALTELALRSKAHWGYDEEFMARVAGELAVTEERLGGILVAERSGGLVGYVELTGDAPTGLVESLFVEPGAMGGGVGTRMLDLVGERARELGMIALELDADPNAASFYLGRGWRSIGSSPSGSVPGRTLPRLRLELATSRE